MAKNTKKPKHPELKPHYEENDYGVGVIVTRIPSGTPQPKINEVMAESRKLAKLHSDNDPYYW